MVIDENLGNMEKYKDLNTFVNYQEIETLNISPEFVRHTSLNDEVQQIPPKKKSSISITPLTSGNRIEQDSLSQLSDNCSYLDQDFTAIRDRF